MHLIAEPLKAAHGSPLNGSPFSFIKIVRAEIAIGSLARQHMIDNDEQTMRNGHNGFLLAASAGEPSKLCPEIGLLDPACTVGCLDQRLPELLTAFACPTAQLLAGTLVIARTQTGPGGQMGGARKPSEVSPNLGQDDFSDAAIDARDRVE